MKWRKEVEENLRGADKYGTHGETIIRDVSRMDAYPNIDDKQKGISPWFKVEIKGLYYRGIEVFLRVEYLRYIESENGWCYANYGDEDAVNVLLVGRIPFDVIKAVEWNGDEYYRIPHTYCTFSKKEKQPYEELVFYRVEHTEGRDYFIEIAKYVDVRKLSKKYPIKNKKILI